MAANTQARETDQDALQQLKSWVPGVGKALLREEPYNEFGLLELDIRRRLEERCRREGLALSCQDAGKLADEDITAFVRHWIDEQDVLEKVGMSESVPAGYLAQTGERPQWLVESVLVK